MNKSTNGHAASQVHISPTHLGIRRGPSPPTTSLPLTSELLQKNHDQLHIFFRDMNGHNHLVHNLLTRLALGATPAQLQTAYDDDLPTQRARPSTDPEVVLKLKNEAYFYERIGKIAHYTDFLLFFEQQIQERGWREVVNEYVFSRSRIAEAILPLMFDGAYHSIIHLGLGVEFEQPSVIAEALAQAAAHDSFDTDYFFLTTEKKAQAIPGPGKSLLELADAISNNETIRAAGKTEGFIGTMKQKRCIFANAGEELMDVAAQFKVAPEDLELRTAEMINFVAYLSGATQSAGKKAKIDFFFMHCVTSSIFFTVLARQEWISLEDRVRLVEWKGRLDLAWYATCGLPDHDLTSVIEYEGGVDGGWDELLRAVNEQHDDGHVAKFVRALMNGRSVCQPFEEGEWAERFPVKGDLWLKIAQMSYDTTLNLPGQAKWVVMTGMNKAWAQVPDSA